MKFNSILSNPPCHVLRLTFHLSRFTLFILLLAIPVLSHAQYFGQNKVQYDMLKFSIYKTPHFNIYYYPEEADAAKDVAQMAEIWYTRLSEVFQHSFNEPHPIILYASPEHFAQTDIIPGLIGEGIGGVTEGEKDRVIIPLVGSWRDNMHVLGHELVHAFQYDILNTSDSLSIRAAENMPLWFIEGMAEYLSIGPYDPNTTMWMRDAIDYDFYPSLKKMTSDWRYFPYRWGEAFWGYVTGIYGDSIIPRLYKSAALYGYDVAVKTVLGEKQDSFSAAWKTIAEQQFEPYMTANVDAYSQGTRIFEDKKAIDEQDFAPSISPNGKYIVFLSARDLFTLDLFLADARSRKIIRRLKTEKGDEHGNMLRLVESAATWSPDSKKLAYLDYEGGKHYLKIVDAAKGTTLSDIEIDNFQSVLNPAWSPDGNTIVFSGVNQGSSDLYVYDLKKKELKPLTHDKFSDLQPSWSPDGKTLAFITDRYTSDFANYDFGKFDLALYHLADSSIEHVPLFQNVNHINPQYSGDSLIYFLAAPDGVSNIYRYNLHTKKIERITHEKTAVAGITDMSPALSIARNTGVLAYTVFKQTGYQVFSLKSENIKAVNVNVTDAMNTDAGMIPPLDRDGHVMVSNYINTQPEPTMADSSIMTIHYKPRLSLSSISNSGSGVGVGTGPFGAGVSGAINLLFSDMLEENILYAAVSASGSVQDIGGLVGYLNQEHRYLWGLQLGHIPYGYYSFLSYYAIDTLSGVPTNTIHQDNYILRQFDDNFELLGAYPFSKVNRLEANAGFDVINYSNRLQTNIYDLYGVYIGREITKLPAPSGFVIGNVSLAFVADDSKFGFTSPLDGYRYRVEVGSTFGAFNFGTLLADLRFYKYVRPVSFAMRAVHYGRYLGDADTTLISPLTIGLDYWVRGYNYYYFDPNEFTADANGNYPQFDRLFGSKIGVVSFEVRFPLTGPREMAPIKSLALPSTLNLFFDGGVAWSGNEPPVFKWDPNSLERIPVFSTGISARVNVLGALVVEGFYAIPFQRPEHAAIGKGVFGLLIVPGW